MKPKVRSRGGAFKRGATFTAVEKSRKEGHTLRPRRRAGRTTPKRSPYTDPALLGQAVPKVPPKSVLQLEQELRVAIGQRDSALKALNDRANVEQLIADFDLLVKTVDGGMQQLRRALRAVLALTEDR